MVNYENAEANRLKSNSNANDDTNYWSQYDDITFYEKTKEKWTAASPGKSHYTIIDTTAGFLSVVDVASIILYDEDLLCKLQLEYLEKCLAK